MISNHIDQETKKRGEIVRLGWDNNGNQTGPNSFYRLAVTERIGRPFTSFSALVCDSLIKVPFLLPVLFCSQHVLGAAHTTSEVVSTTSQPLLFAVLSFSNFTLNYFFSFN